MNALMPEKKSTVFRDVAAARKMICSQYVFGIYPIPHTVIANAPNAASSPIEGLDGDTLAEISEHLSLYAETVLLIEVDGCALCVLPTLYPSSSLGIALCFDIKTEILLRMIDAASANDIFVVSKRIKKTPSRLSNGIRERVGAFSELCEEIRKFTFGLERLSLCLTPKEKMNEIIAQCYGISYFTGCPISLRHTCADLADDALELLDFPLLTAFLITMLISARQKALDRSAEIALDPKYSSVTVSVRFRAERSVCVEREFSDWKRLAYEKNMLFDISHDGELLCVRLNPCRAEWSLLGVKQND